MVPAAQQSLSFSLLRWPLWLTYIARFFSIAGSERNGHTHWRDRPVFHIDPESVLGRGASSLAGALPLLPLSSVHGESRLRPKSNAAAISDATPGHRRDVAPGWLSLL